MRRSAQLLERYGLKFTLVARGEAIPGSYWGESEAGLKGERLYARPDTPVHSVLHESSSLHLHEPRAARALERDAGGDDLEEAAVCYLQILLAEQLPGVGCARLLPTWTRWGYSFRLGSTRAWFEEDAADARAWLARHGHPRRWPADRPPVLAQEAARRQAELR